MMHENTISGVFWSTSLSHIDSDSERQTRTVSCHEVRSKGDLLMTLATGLGFPEEFGHNWDALLDALSEAVTASKGLLLLLDGLSALALTAPDVLATLVEVLRDCAGELFAEGVPFTVVVQLDTAPTFSIADHPRF